MRNLTIAVAVIAIAYACGGRSDVMSNSVDATAPDAGACGPGPGATLCNGSCTDVLSSHVNCGACGVVCASGKVCSWGHCTETCASGLLDCGGDCVDVADDPHHCGSCANDCGLGAACTSGTCVDLCGLGEMLCPSGCVDPQSSNANCGTCGHACPTDAACTSGACVCNDPAATLCGATCTNLMTDDANCGACGNVCGGTCTYGRCLVTLASGQWWPGAIAVDDARVFWSNGFETDAGNISSVPIDGGTPTVLLQATVAENLAASSDRLYMTLPLYAPPARMAKDGGSFEFLNTGPLGGGCSLALDQNYAYVGTVRVPLDGGPGVIMQNGYPWGWCPSATGAFDTRRQYWPTSATLESLPVDGGTMFTIASNLNQPQAVAVDSTAIYWSTYGASGSIQRTAIGGGGVIETLASNLFYPNQLVIDGSNLYFEETESPDGAILRMPTSGGTPIVLADKQPFPTYLVVDATSVYWSNRESGTVMKLTPK